VNEGPKDKTQKDVMTTKLRRKTRKNIKIDAEVLIISPLKMTKGVSECKKTDKNTKNTEND